MTLNHSRLLSISAAAILGLAACNKTTTAPTRTTVGTNTSTAPSGQTAKAGDKALVRFINATSTPKDLYFGDDSAFSNIGPLDASPYQELPADRRQFKLYSAGKDTGNPLVSNSEGPTAGQHYTVIAMNGTNGKPILDPVMDNLTQPSSGKAKVRVIHAAAGAKKVDICRAGRKDAIIGGVAFKDVTSYKEVDPTVTEIDVRATGSRSGATTLRNLTLEPGKFYTLVVMGGRELPVTSKVIEDQVLQNVASSR